MSSSNVSEFWKCDKKYQSWVFAREVPYQPGCLPRFYFIKDCEDDPSLCAFIKDGVVIAEFSVLTMDALINARITDEDKISGVCLENLELSISENGDRYAFPMIEEGLPYLYLDGKLISSRLETNEGILWGIPLCVWFSPDSSKVIAKFMAFNPQAIEESNLYVAGFVGEEEEDPRCFVAQEADFYCESNGGGKIVFRPGVLAACTFVDDNRALLAFLNRVTLDLVVRFHCHTLLKARLISNFSEYMSDGSRWFTQSFFSCSPCGRFFVFCCHDDEEPSIYLLDINTLPDSITCWPERPADLFARVIPNSDLLSVTWVSGGLRLEYLKGEVPTQDFLLLPG
ncbi:MAG TPA: hypothetical protein PKA63_14360 [Oligoflexia bacterium]|nr:hypothetical protein [Oligoflexia bacterium]HMP49848.1 hypothetical protein [Oligoflexia bacterium]